MAKTPPPPPPQNGKPPVVGPVLSSPGNPYPGYFPLTPTTTDPGFQPIGDPLQDLDSVRNRARVINREIPNVVIQSGWTIKRVRNALVDLVAGNFDAADQLDDAIAGDSRVQSAMRSRSGGLLGREIRFRTPKRAKDQKMGRRCRAAFEDHWADMEAEPALLFLLEKASTLGFAYSQLLWDTTGKLWKPYLQNFAARFAYYHWTYRAHIAITLDGPTPITPGDAKWVLHAPYGAYRGWMRGALRAVAQWWLARNYALRDWSRYSERHGFPVILGDTPFGADPKNIAAFQSALAGLGQESTLQLPGSVDVQKYGRYDLRYLEAKVVNWETFRELINQCNDEITLALLGQNLTTQVKEGSFAAARVHADVRQAILEAEARALQRTIYTQIARPFAAINFGDPDLAPIIAWDVRPVEDLHVKAQGFQSFAAAAAQLRQAGIQIENIDRFARLFGFESLEVSNVAPLQVAAQKARATGEEDPEKVDKAVEKVDKDAEEAAAREPTPKARVYSSASLRHLKRSVRDTRAKLRTQARALRAQERALSVLKETPEPKPSPAAPERLPFAQRSAAFLADVREQRDLGFEPNLRELARLHDVPEPKRAPK